MGGAEEMESFDGPGVEEEEGIEGGIGVEAGWNQGFSEESGFVLTAEGDLHSPNRSIDDSDGAEAFSLLLAIDEGSMKPPVVSSTSSSVSGVGPTPGTGTGTSILGFETAIDLFTAKLFLASAAATGNLRFGGGSIPSNEELDAHRHMRKCVTRKDTHPPLPPPLPSKPPSLGRLASLSPFTSGSSDVPLESSS